MVCVPFKDHPLESLPKSKPSSNRTIYTFLRFIGSAFACSVSLNIANYGSFRNSFRSYPKKNHAERLCLLGWLIHFRNHIKEYIMFLYSIYNIWWRTLYSLKYVTKELYWMFPNKFLNLFSLQLSKPTIIAKVNKSKKLQIILVFLKRIIKLYLHYSLPTRKFKECTEIKYIFCSVKKK